MTKPTFIASDVHLGAVPKATERAFLRFLAHVGRNGRRLLLAGDLFDFWFEYGSIIPGRHYRVLAALADLVEDGVDVVLVGGNHDAWGGPFLRDEVGVAFHPDGVRIELAGRPALIRHGDGVGSGDLKYRLLKAVIRSRPAILAFRALHPQLGVRLADAVSATDTKVERPEVVRGRARHIEAWALGRLRADLELGWVVCGHAHFPAIRELEERRYYLNAGDWVRHQSYITVRPDGVPELHTWSDQTAGS